MPAVCLLVISIKLLDGIHKGLFGNTPLQHRLIQRQLKTNRSAGNRAFPEQGNTFLTVLWKGTVRKYIEFSAKSHPLIRDGLTVGDLNTPEQAVDRIGSDAAVLLKAQMQLIDVLFLRECGVIV